MKIAQFIVDGFEDVEAITTLDLLDRANIEIDSISLFDKEIVRSAHNQEFKPNKLLSEVAIDSYDGYILPGGPGSESYYHSEELITILETANENNKLIAAICAAPAYLKKIGLLDRRKATVFYSFISQLQDDKTNYIDSRVVVDGNIITANALGSAIDFSLAIIEYLQNRELSIKIKEEIFY